MGPTRSYKEIGIEGSWKPLWTNFPFLPRLLASSPSLVPLTPKHTQGLSILWPSGLMLPANAAIQHSQLHAVQVTAVSSKSSVLLAQGCHGTEGKVSKSYSDVCVEGFAIHPFVLCTYVQQVNLAARHHDPDQCPVLCSRSLKQTKQHYNVLKSV